MRIEAVEHGLVELVGEPAPVQAGQVTGRDPTVAVDWYRQDILGVVGSDGPPISYGRGDWLIRRRRSPRPVGGASSSARITRFHSAACRSVSASANSDSSVSASLRAAASAELADLEAASGP